MPQLVVNLDDIGDCRRSMKILRGRIQDANEKSDDKSSGGAAKPPKAGGDKPSELPLRQRLQIIAQRGVWKHLVAIAGSDATPRSLPEWDDQLDLPRNKLRSLKGNFAKLENRFDLRFLKVAEAAAPDENNNPRYIMPPRVRNQILAIAEQTKN